MRTLLTSLVLLLNACSADTMLMKGTDDLDGGGDLDTALNECRSDQTPILQLGTAGPSFEPWATDTSIIIEVSSEGGLSLPFAIASENTPLNGQLSAWLTLESGESLGTQAGKDLLLFCNGSDLLISDPQRLTVTWAGDSFDLFALPATLTVEVTFPDGPTLQTVVNGEITF